MSRIALYFAGGLLALLAIALLAVNLYVQSQATQARIQQELSERLGTTLRIERMSVTPWWGLKLTGITMPQSDRTIAGDFLAAETFRLRIRSASLFSGHLVIKEVSLVRPKVVWAQNSDGKWRLPVLPVSSPSPIAAQETKPVAQARAPEAAGAADTKRARVPRRAEAAEPETASASPFTPEVRRVTLVDGNFHFLDGKGRLVAAFEGVGFRSSLRNSTELRGNASIDKISLRDRFFLEKLKSPVTYDPGGLEFSEITALAGGGDITGRFRMKQAEAQSPFEAMVAFRDVQADRVLTDAGGPAGMIQGRIEGRLDAKGKTADPNALAGKGELFLRDGQVKQYSLLVALGQILQLNELAQLHLDQAQVQYHIDPGIVTIDELLLASSNLRLSATGTIDFAGKVRLGAQLAISERIRGQLFSGLRESFVPASEAGYSAVAFDITGTVDRPKTNLMGKLVGPQLKDLNGLINGLLGGGKSDRPKKKRPAEEVVGPSPQATAQPEATTEPEPVDSPAPIAPPSP